MTEEELTKLENLLLETPPGPWLRGREEQVVFRDGGSCIVTEDPNGVIRRFMIGAREALPRLLALVRQHEEERRERIVLPKQSVSPTGSTCHVCLATLLVPSSPAICEDCICRDEYCPCHSV